MRSRSIRLALVAALAEIPRSVCLGGCQLGRRVMNSRRIDVRGSMQVSLTMLAHKLSEVVLPDDIGNSRHI